MQRILEKNEKIRWKEFFNVLLNNTNNIENDSKDIKTEIDNCDGISNIDKKYIIESYEVINALEKIVDYNKEKKSRTEKNVKKINVNGVNKKVTKIKQIEYSEKDENNEIEHS